MGNKSCIIACEWLWLAAGPIREPVPSADKTSTALSFGFCYRMMTSMMLHLTTARYSEKCERSNQKVRVVAASKPKWVKGWARKAAGQATCDGSKLTPTSRPESGKLCLLRVFLVGKLARLFHISFNGRQRGCSMPESEQQ